MHFKFTPNIKIITIINIHYNTQVSHLGNSISHLYFEIFLRRKYLMTGNHFEKSFIKIILLMRFFV